MTSNLFGGQAVFGLGDETIDDDAEQLDIPIHAFDLIVADECHRGYTSSAVSNVAGAPDFLHYYGDEGRHLVFRLRFFGRTAGK